MPPQATLAAADRLLTAIMALLRAAAGIVTTGSTPTLPDAAAVPLFLRLQRLVHHLLRLAHFGAPTPPRPAYRPNTQAAPPLPVTRNMLSSLPRRPGWLLAVLPDTAPAIAADLSLVLADPAVATLLAAAPTLHRMLRPLLRSLGLTTSPPPSPTTPPRPQPPAPSPARLRPLPNRPTPANFPTPSPKQTNARTVRYDFAT